MHSLTYAVETLSRETGIGDTFAICNALAALGWDPTETKEALAKRRGDPLLDLVGVWQRSAARWRKTSMEGEFAFRHLAEVRVEEIDRCTQDILKLFYADAGPNRKT